MRNKINILRMQVDVTSYSEALQHVVSWSEKNLNKYICVSNVHMCMEVFDNPEFRSIVNNADLIVPDGKPLVWAQKLLGEKDASQVRGSNFLLKICTAAEKNGIPIGFYGGAQDSLNDFLWFMNNKYPKLKITFSFAPPFRELSVQEELRYIEEINNSGVRILFIGIGCPKQERWMAKHKDNLSCVTIGVGAAFDFFSGKKKHAPLWMQKYGLEWAFRLASDPKRLWKRYLKHNPRFIYYFGKQFLVYKLKKDRTLSEVK